MEKIKNNLLSVGIKPTYLRIKIYQFLLESKDHPTGKMIYQALKKFLPTISLTTIYNNLELFCRKGLIKMVLLDPKEIRFDGKKGHHHFLCEKCGKIIDLPIDCDLVKKKKIFGHLIIDWDGYFLGICKDCQK
uniref:Transcriptional repressor n=1 Tax=candidate division WOR-3 bacterium TaxID=2052148 RepID=A0A7V3ZUX9_UNCW3